MPPVMRIGMDSTLCPKFAGKPDVSFRHARRISVKIPALFAVKSIRKCMTDVRHPGMPHPGEAVAQIDCLFRMFSICVFRILISAASSVGTPSGAGSVRSP